MGFSDKKLTKDKSEKWQEILLYAFIFAGIFVTIYSVIYNRSLWMDEARVANNIVVRNFIELLKPLDRNQVAPIGYLYIQKLIIIVLGKSDWVLRIFSLFSFLLSMRLFYLLNKIWFKSKVSALFACTLFSLTASLLIYSWEVKQYSSDVLVALILLHLAIRFSKSINKKTLFYYTLGGVIAIWFSNTAIIMLFTVGLYTLYTTYISDKKRILTAGIPIAFWLISFFVYYSLFIHNHANQASMLRYWKDSFLPGNIFEENFYIFLAEKAKMVFTKLLGFPRKLLGFSNFWLVPFVFLIIGFLANIKSKAILFLTVFPIFVHLAISSFELYPFSRRLILYLTPLFIILYSQGILMAYHLVRKKWGKIAVLILVIALVFNSQKVARDMPFEHVDVKNGMRYINKNIDPNSTLYIYHASISPFNFYKNEYTQIKSIDDVIYGGHSKKNWNKYDEEILNLSGNFWILFSHVYRNKETRETEEEYFIQKLKANGYKIIDSQSYKRSAVYEIEKQE